MTSFPIHIQNTAPCDLVAYVTGYDFATMQYVMGTMDASGNCGTWSPELNSITKINTDLPTDVAKKVAIRVSKDAKVTFKLNKFIRGGRIWFLYNETNATDACLTFKLDPAAEGKAVPVEPTSISEAHPDQKKKWSYMEFTYADATVQSAFNISFVDFLCIPVGIKVEGTSVQGGQSNEPGRVWGLKKDGLQTMVDKVKNTTTGDGIDWKCLIQYQDAEKTKPLRVMCPSHVTTLCDRGYLDPWIAKVWNFYDSTKNPNNMLTIKWNKNCWTGVTSGVNTPFVFTPSTDNKVETGFGDNALAQVSFPMPTTRQVWEASGGGFSNTTPTSASPLIGVVLSAAFMRGTACLNSNQPTDEKESTFYDPAQTVNGICNYYAKWVHEVAQGGLGYAYPYDDNVAHLMKEDPSGLVKCNGPTAITITVGGTVMPSAPSRLRKKENHMYGNRGQLLGPNKFRRDLNWLADPYQEDQVAYVDEKKAPLVAVHEVSEDDDSHDVYRDLEKGEYPTRLDGYAASSPPSRFDVPQVVRQVAEPVLSVSHFTMSWFANPY